MNLLDDYTLEEVDLLKDTPLFQNYDEYADIIHLLLIKDEAESCNFFSRRIPC
jgi:hypothetical protein